jgi:uncharacterized membrane protein YcaP (DUF421 family)
MIETQLAQIAAAILVENNGKVSGQPKNSFDKVTAVTMRGGNPLVIHRTLTIRQEKQKSNKRRGLHHLRKHKKTKKSRGRHHKTSSTQATCRSPQEIESKPWTSNSLI